MAFWRHRQPVPRIAGKRHREVRGLSLQVRYARVGIISWVAKVREDAAEQVVGTTYNGAVEYSKMLLAYA